MSPTSHREGGLLQAISINRRILLSQRTYSRCETAFRMTLSSVSPSNTKLSVPIPLALETTPISSAKPLRRRQCQTKISQLFWGQMILWLWKWKKFKTAWLWGRLTRIGSTATHGRTSGPYLRRTQGCFVGKLWKSYTTFQLQCKPRVH